MPRALKPMHSESSVVTSENTSKAKKMLKRLIEQDEFVDNIVDSLSKKHEGSCEDFNTHLRMILQGLRKNKELVEKIKDKSVTASAIVDMENIEIPKDVLAKMKKVKEEEQEKNKPLDPSKMPDHPSEVCRKCHSKKIDETSAQTRSADEPMTLMFKCCNCGFEWRRSSA